MANRPALEMRWVPVTDEQGRTRMQAVWIEPLPQRRPPHAADAACADGPSERSRPQGAVPAIF